ncbi:MAG TPA: DUF4912 domain-containing protein, partial [Anaeromyxobacteraceae bacterium]|nr:DUF4912 domain-containing protein [Anaeromyxobacteraceae bacterium]
MADLRKMTVQSLRELARKVLGPGYSRLKTKGELVAALEQAEKKVASAVEKAGSRVRQATRRAGNAAKAPRAAARKPEAPAPEGSRKRKRAGAVRKAGA